MVDFPRRGITLGGMSSAHDPASSLAPILERARSPAQAEALDAIFLALADPTRRAILTMLLEDDMAVTDVAEAFPQSLAGISKHLSVLADCGLISQEKRGRVKWCKLEPDSLKTASVWMQAFGQFEPVDLDGLERFLAQELSAPEAAPE